MATQPKSDEVCSASAPVLSERETVILWGREWEVIFSMSCDRVPDDYVLPNGRLDLSKYEPLKGPLARAAADQSSPSIH